MKQVMGGRELGIEPGVDMRLEDAEGICSPG
jgi:hypothetical protein